jgi:Carboxypeptidase regulatory-like domain
MKRSLILPLIAITVIVAAFLFFDPFSSPAEPIGLADGTEAVDEGAQATPDLAEAGLAEAVPSETDDLARTSVATTSLGELGQAFEAGGAYAIRAIGPDGSLARPAEFLVQGFKGQIERLQRPTGVLEMPDFSMLKRVAAYADGAWSKSIELSDFQSQKQVELKVDQAAASITVNLSRAGVGLEGKFTCVYAYSNAPVDLGEMLASSFGDGPEAPVEGQGISKLFAATFRNSSHTAPATQGVQGTWTLTELPPGQYRIELSSEFGVPAQQRISLEPGQDLVLDIELANGAWIEGRLITTEGVGVAKGRVVYGKALEGYAEMFTERQLQARVLNVSGFNTRADAALTDEDGKFRLGPLETGEGVVFVGADDYLPTRVAQVETTPGQTLELEDFTLQSGHSVAILASDAQTGDPLSDCTVSWKPSSGQDSLIPLDRWTPVETELDDLGRMVLSNLPFENLSLRVEHSGYAPYTTDYLMPRKAWDPNGPIPMLQAPLLLGLQIKGRVVSAQDDSAVNDAVVMVLDESALSTNATMFMAMNAGSLPTTSSAADGSFGFQDLPPGEYLVQVEHNDFATGRSEVISLHAGAEIDVLIRLDKGATVLVHYLGADGQAEANRSIILQNTAMGAIERESTDELGKCSFENLPAGKFQVSTIAGNTDPDSFVEGEMDLNFKFFELSPGEVLELELGPGLAQSSISGLLTRGGEPQAGLSFAVFGEVGLKTAKTDADGHFELKGLKAGPHSYFCGPVNAPTVTGTMHIKEGVNPFELDLPGGGLQVLVVKASDNSVVAGIPVTLDDQGTRGNPIMMVTGPDGIAAFDFLEVNTYRVNVGTAAMPIFGGNEEVGSKMTEVTTGSGTTEITVRLEQGAIFKARVLGTDGRPVQGASMYYLDADGQPLSIISMKSSNSKGVVQLTGLPAGPGRILVKMAGMGQQEIAVNLVAGQTSKQEIRLESGALVYIQITDEADQNQAGILAVLEDGRGTRLSMLISIPESAEMNQAIISGGEQKLGPVAPGSYTLKLFRLGGGVVEYPVEVPRGVPEVHFRYAYPL